jgi:acyl-CoA reductase-like NAD-dependent aldehyde dehydrogenase
MIQLNNPEIFKTDCLIDGKWITTGKKITIKNPFDNSPVARVPELDKDLIEESIDSAWQAFSTKKSSVQL